jgi:carbonic anhydrase/acetyltransferase-like protein (isoleucine patch superfamily)
MITIQDDATVNALFQAHTFEDRVLKIDQVEIEPNATIGAGAVLFYGARVGAGAHVLPQGVVMKHEHLTAGRTYAGCPTEVR